MSAWVRMCLKTVYVCPRVSTCVRECVCVFPRESTCVRVCSRMLPSVRVCPRVSACVRVCPRVSVCVDVTEIYVDPFVEIRYYEYLGNY